jgi:two-component system, NarL family, nitrate/nitrite response regulator NarL
MAVVGVNDMNQPPPQTLRVVIADENPVARQFLSRVVTDSFSDPVEIVECSDTTAAADLMTAPTGLLLVDQQLPDGGALELLTQIRSHTALKVVTTLYSDDDRLFDLIRLGAAGYLLKEDRFEVQVEQLQRIAQGQPPMSPAIARRALAAFGGGPGRTPEQGLGKLDASEADVLSRLSRGYTLREVATSLSLSTMAVYGHVRSISLKLQQMA